MELQRRLQHANMGLDTDDHRMFAFERQQAVHIVLICGAGKCQLGRGRPGSVRKMLGHGVHRGAQPLGILFGGQHRHIHARGGL